MKKRLSYHEILKILKDNNICALRAFVANTVEACLYPKTVCEEKFEEICDVVYDECVLETENDELIVWNIVCKELKKRHLF